MDYYCNMKNLWGVWPLQGAVQVWGKDEWRDMKAERQGPSHEGPKGHVLGSLDFI